MGHRASLIGSFQKPVEVRPLRIVGDAAIASPLVGEGRFIPVVILDTTNRPDVVEYIRVHTFVAEGDVTCRWGRSPDLPNHAFLNLSVVRPVELVITINFDIVRHGILVEQVLSSKAIYIQAGKEGDRVKHNPDAPKVIMEIPDTGFRPLWDKLFMKALRADMRERGLNGPQAKRAAKSTIEEIKIFGEKRVPTPRSHDLKQKA
jgi:hypothetical protein